MKPFLLTAALGIALWANSGLAADIKPLDPQPDPESLKPGLAVLYYDQFFRHIDEMIDWEGYKEGRPGEALPQLNYSVGTGDVLTSGSDDGVGAKITGLIEFKKPGSYALAFESNDGVRLEIDGQMILEDPDVHGDRFSEIVVLEVPQAGWYPLTIRYFERKNTSTLKFYWQEPDFEGGTMPLVPTEAFAH
ncbi:MAG: PA14 domain-containing protein [Pseudomonadota bacterium]